MNWAGPSFILGSRDAALPPPAYGVGIYYNLRGTEPGKMPEWEPRGYKDHPELWSGGDFAMGNPEELAGQARYGITIDNSLGIRMPELRRLAREAERNHELAAQLWASGMHEARLLATMVDDPRQVTGEQMESWVRDFDSWDVVDGVCDLGVLVADLFQLHDLARLAAPRTLRMLMFGCHWPILQQ